MPKKPTVSKPAALLVVLGLAVVVVLLIVGLVKLIGSGYADYEGQCLPSDVQEQSNNPKYGDMFIDCSDPDAHWEVTRVYSSEPSNADWSTESKARRWLERECDVTSANASDRAAFVFREGTSTDFLACATAVG
jgi:hypothetical protein